MNADDHCIATRDIAAKPFYLVGIDIRRRHLDRGRQVEDRRALGRRLPNVQHPLANIEREIRLGEAEGLRRVFEGPVGLRALQAFLQHRSDAGDGQIGDLVPLHPEDDAAKQRSRCVVEMNDRLARPLQRFEGAGNQILARLGEHLNRYVIGNPIVLDQGAHEVEFGLGRRRKSDLDFLEPGGEQHVVEAQLAFDIHRIGKRLIAVTQIGGQPAGRFREPVGRPFAILQVNGRNERTIFDFGIGQHGVIRCDAMCEGFDTADYGRREAVWPDDRR